MQPKTIYVWIVDTNVLTILMGQVLELKHIDGYTDLQVEFGVGKDFHHYNINVVVDNVGERTSISLSVSHAYTGCNTTSSFF